jgi:hypothetical protein
VRGLFQKDPDRFIKEILVIGNPDYVLEVETQLLEQLDARNDIGSYNGHNNKNNVNSAKVGRLTKELSLGVHGRSKEKIIEDCKKAGAASCHIRHAKKGEDGKSLYAKKIGYASHTVRDERGKSVRMVGVGKRNMDIAHADKDQAGKSLFVMKSWSKCNECGYENLAMIVGKHQKATGHSGRTRVEKSYNTGVKEITHKEE